ncbi:MAG: hypothetical protein FCKEOINB_01785 [Nitrosomonas sp.]|nr:hypothetical protein [Nitrosomonas sp.]
MLRKSQISNLKSLSLIAAGIIAASTPSLVLAYKNPLGDHYSPITIHDNPDGYQISPNPNFSTITINDINAENRLEPFDNYGNLVINGSGRLVTFGTLNNYSNLINYGSLYTGKDGLFFIYGYPEYRDNGEVVNSNLFTNYGEFGNGSLLRITSTGIMNNYGDVINVDSMVLNPSSILNNYGTINNSNSYPLESSARLNISGSLYNSGTLNNGGSITIDKTGLLVNSGTLYQYTNGFANYGTLENSGSWYNADARYLTNGGELINTGSFMNTYALMNSVKVFNSGIISESPNTLGYGIYSQYIGETINNGIIDMTTIDIEGGVLKGIGTLKGSVIIGPGATVMPGLSPGILNIEGDMHSNGNYVIEIAGLNSGQFDVLNIHGNAFFTGGNFEFDFINGFHPSAGDHWDFLVADSLNGFDTVNFTFAGLGDGLGIDLNNEGGKISFTVITVVPEPETYAMVLAGLGLIGFMTYRRKLKEAA